MIVRSEMEGLVRLLLTSTLTGLLEQNKALRKEYNEVPEEERKFTEAYLIQQHIKDNQTLIAQIRIRNKRRK